MEKNVVHNHGKSKHTTQMQKIFSSLLDDVMIYFNSYYGSEVEFLAAVVVVVGRKK